MNNDEHVNEKRLKRWSEQVETEQQNSKDWTKKQHQQIDTDRQANHDEVTRTSANMERKTN